MTDELISSEVNTLIESLLTELRITNYTIHVSPGSNRGDNYLGIIAKVAVTGKDENGERKVINLMVKSAPRNEAYRSVAPIRVAYEREIYIYSKVFPEMAKLQEERGITNLFTSHPRFYKSTMCDKNETLIMENMKELGFELRDRHCALNLNHVLLVMKEYGRFHALSFALRKHKPEVFREIFDNTQEEFFRTFDKTEVMKKSIVSYCDRALRALDPIDDKIAYEKLDGIKNRFMDVVQEILDSRHSGEYAVIGHGDSWVNNMLFNYNNNCRPHSPSQVCLLDWQLARAGSPALDLSYFIFTCTDKPLRDKHYDYLIKEYYNSLSAFLHELGCDPEELFPFNVLQEHLKKYCIYGLYMSIMVLYIMNSDVDEVPDIHNMTDPDEVLERFQYETKNLEEYYERVRGVILDYVRFGYNFGIE